MDQHESFLIELKCHIMCKLKILIYGLKQTSRQWYIKFNDIIKSLVFKKMSLVNVYINRSKGTSPIS